MRCLDCEPGLGLNEEQYRSVCEACDRVLLATDATIKRVAIPWLHVIREHRVFLANYVELLQRTQSYFPQLANVIYIERIVRRC